MADAGNEPAIDAVAQLVPATLKALHALEFAGRHLSLSSLPQLIDAMTGRDDEVNAALSISRALDWPGRLAPVRERLEPAAEAAAQGIAGLRAAADAPQPIVAAYRALRNYAKAAEAIYPMTAFLKPVSQFFLEPSARTDSTLIDRLAAVDPAHGNVGVMHLGGPAGTRGFVVIAPTAIGSTWSLMEPDVDGPSIDRMVEHVAAQWNIDATRKLLTGMSDGGTFTYVLGLRGACRFSHLAPIAAAFHPMLMSFADADRVRGLPIHIVHGAQDWMFPPELARSAERTLAEAGAAVVLREIADLSHTYPRDENGHILDWFLGRAKS